MKRGVHRGRTGQFDVHVGIQEQVLGFEVTVDDVVPVAVVDGCKNLPKFLPRFRFAHAAV